MADNEKEQAAEPAQEEEPQQSPVPEQELSLAQENDKKDKKDDGLLLPILYALLAAIGVFTLIMFIGIGITFFQNRNSAPSEQTSYQDTVPPDQEADEE